MLIRDLMVNLAAQEAGGAAPALFFPCYCTYWTCGGTCGGTCYASCYGFSWCVGSRHGTQLCPQIEAAIDPAAASQQLGVLKAQLQQALLQIEQQEQALAQISEPQTLAQVEERESKLQEELAKLDKRKKELAKK